MVVSDGSVDATKDAGAHAMPSFSFPQELC